MESVVFFTKMKVFFKGYLFPSGFRIFGVEKRQNSSYDFFLENRNFLMKKSGLLGAIIPKKSDVAQVIEAKLVLIIGLHENDIGDIHLRYRSFLSHKKPTKV